MAGVAGSAREEAPQAQEVMVGWPFQAQEAGEAARSEVCATVGDHGVAQDHGEARLALAGWECCGNCSLPRGNAAGIVFDSNANSPCAS